MIAGIGDSDLFYAFQWITDLSVKIIFDNFTVKIIKI
jgi:hypothetical protein